MMDGLPQEIRSGVTVGANRGTQTASMAATSQRTLRAAIDCVGIGLHSGVKVKLALLPALPDTGIVFRRTDLPGSPDLPARFDHVVDTRMCTVLGHPDHPECRVGTVEHVMAALAGCGIDNAVVALDGPEVPILDGSSASFVFLIGCAGQVEQDAPSSGIEVLRPVRVSQGAAFAELRPHSPHRDSDHDTGHDRRGFDMAMSIRFDAPAIGHQAFSLQLTSASFEQELARARTFTLAGDVARLQASGLARGGSLDNAVVVDEARVLNPGGLRMPDEFVRHKLLDAVGDLALAGARLQGRFTGHCSGHALNNRLLHALFAQRANWRRREATAHDGALAWMPGALHAA